MPHRLYLLWERFLSAILVRTTVKQHRGYNPLPQDREIADTIRSHKTSRTNFLLGSVGGLCKRDFPFIGVDGDRHKKSPFPKEGA